MSSRYTKENVKHNGYNKKNVDDVENNFFYKYISQYLGGPQDAGNVLLLLFLYILQGVPLGLAGAVPLILQQYAHVTYKEQAFFSFVFWPFSCKLLWAPIVDAIYWRKMGWRKSWLIPTQYLIGLVMLALSLNVDSLISQARNSTYSMFLLTCAFFLLNTLAATQDIAVDGWALTMLSRKNVELASTCNSIGQTAGYFLGNIVFLAFESADFCNKYIRTVPSSKGLMTFPDFLRFWGIFFMFSTTLVWLFKREKPHYPMLSTSTNSNTLTKNKRMFLEDAKDTTDYKNSALTNIYQTYYTLWDILKLPHIRSYILICLTMKIGFAAADGVTGLKLMDADVSKENLAFIAVPLVPLQILFPLIINRYTDTQRPIDLILRVYPWRLLIGGLFAILVWWTTTFPYTNVAGQAGLVKYFPSYYYGILFLSYAIHQVASYSMYVAIMAFHAKISDPGVGGTYMTLLNTITNLGGNWPSTLALGIVESLNIKRCPGMSYFSAQYYNCMTSFNPSAVNTSGLNTSNSSSNSSNPSSFLSQNLSSLPSNVNQSIHSQTLLNEPCQNCTTLLDGYYVESILCILIGFAWLRWKAKAYWRLQNLPLAAWRVSRKNS